MNRENHLILTTTKHSAKNAGNEPDSWVLKALKGDAEIHLAATLLSHALSESNKIAGKTLYRQTLEETQQFLTGISALYGVYEKAGEALIAILAVEEDSIERIAVEASFQHRGIGSALMQFAKESLEARYVDVYADNQQALHFFESCGFSMFDETAPEPGDLMVKDPHKVIHLMI